MTLNPKRILPTLAAGLAVLLLLSLPAITTAQSGSHNVIDDFLGRAHIHVLNNTNTSTADPVADRIGCLNAQGWLTLDDCAVFTRADDPNVHHTLSTSAGNCSFQDPAMPKNVDSVYGSNTHAWSCGPGAGDGMVEYYYTITGFNYPFVCQGNINCFYDIKATAPGEDTAPMPVWAFYWGSQQFDVPPGHWRVLWLWARVPEE
ncbi:hypothetical protein C8A03DRAFT_35005 [Achaetomium macrosporum]|uniref:Secreted protein n=1 Tax=Achaetomium macrosporum TaxID=79813 RepID=A0AAN7C806_9PEZI|nr:hypothetical protein C8A03DRAFT_35005 [Achaetomium macrosporum]